MPPLREIRMLAGLYCLSGLYCSLFVGWMLWWCCKPGRVDLSDYITHMCSWGMFRLLLCRLWRSEGQRVGVHVRTRPVGWNHRIHDPWSSLWNHGYTGILVERS